MTVVTVVTRVTAVLMALVTIATVAIVLGWVVMWRVGWCRWGGGRIKANDTASIFFSSRAVIVGEHDGSADEAVFATKVLHESRQRVRLFGFTVSVRSLSRCIESQICHRASSLRVCDVRILQGVVHWTNVGARRRRAVVLSNVSVLVDSKRENITVVTARSVTRYCALDLNRVAWELAEVEGVCVILAARSIDNASGVDRGAELGGNVRNLGSGVLERIVGVVWLMVVVVGAVRVVGRGDATVSRRRGLVALGLRMLRRVVSALRLVVRGGLVIGLLMGVGWPVGGVLESATVLESAGSRDENGKSETLHYDFIF